MHRQTDFCVLGAGLAGLSLADALREQGFDTAVVEKNDIAAGASGTSGGLVNPATGRRATKTWKAEPCYETIAENLKKIQTNTRRSFYQKSGLLRPAVLRKMARKMRKQYRKTNWPDGWCQWKSEGEIKEMHPGIVCVDGGLWLPIGLSVDVAAFLHAYARYLSEAGVVFFINKEPTIIQDKSRWIVEIDNETIKTRQIVFAIGGATKTSYWWDWLPLHLIKGQTATFSTGGAPLTFSHALSSLGYMAQTQKPDTIVQGSTYEHDFDHLNPDKEGERYLRNRMRRTLPDLERKIKTVSRWAGLRTSTPDKKPILGAHPVHPSMHLFTGLGSKGLLYSKFLADHYVDHLTKGTNLYPEVDIIRFTFKK